MNLSDFTQSRWREWLDHTGYNETDWPYLDALDMLQRNPDAKDARSIREFMAVWKIGRSSGAKPDKQGILFGTAWLSYDKMLGYEGPDGPERERFYRENGIARALMSWANNEMRDEK